MPPWPPHDGDQGGTDNGSLPVFRWKQAGRHNLATRRHRPDAPPF
ncbi:hypothetical protein [Streptomyces diastaticus]